MRKIQTFFLLLLMCQASLWASWNEITASLSGPQLTVKSKRGERTYLELAPGKPLVVDMQKKSSIRWKVQAEGDGKFTIHTGKAEVFSRSVQKGTNDLKVYLEPGTYQIRCTTPARVRSFIWKKRKLTSVVPEGGGFAVYLRINDKNYAYYRTVSDTIPVLKVEGPTTAYVFFRTDIPEDRNRGKVDITITENDSVIEHRISRVPKSKKTSLAENGATSLSEAFVLNLKVPKGIHRYSVIPHGCTGVVKFYRNARKKRALYH